MTFQGVADVVGRQALPPTSISRRTEFSRRTASRNMVAGAGGRGGSTELTVEVLPPHSRSAPATPAFLR